MSNKLFSLVIALITTTCITAQVEKKPFEGEIIYETYENYSNGLLKIGSSIFFNGVHRVHLVIKGNKMHLFDETTSCHSQSNSTNNTYIQYCEYTKRGINWEKFLDTQLMLSPRDLIVAGQRQVLLTNTFERKEENKEFLGHKCQLYQGVLERKNSAILQKYELKAYVAEEMLISSVYKYHVYGWDLHSIAMSWQIRYDGGHLPMGIGEASFYIEADVVDIIPREVEDSEFDIPSDYKIFQNAKNILSLSSFYKDVNKALEANGIKGGDVSTKTTGVHFKTEGEWEF